jgi:hypothetical protein
VNWINGLGKWDYPGRNAGWTMLLEQAAREPGWGRVARLISRVPRLLRDIRSHRGWFLFFVFGRLMPARRLVAAVTAWRAGRVVPGTAACCDELSGPTVAEAVALLRRDGLCPGLRLSDTVVAEVQAYAGSRPCFGGLDWSTSFWPAEQPEAERRTGQALVVGHFPDNDRACPAIARLIGHPWLHAVAAGYFGTGATVLDVRLWWSFASAAPSRAALKLAGQNTFHFDLTDWTQLKFFFYLTEVGEASGPHRFVRGSHARRPILQQLSPFSSKTDAQIRGTYGADAIQTITGPAGYGFAEDPFGFHTGATVQEGKRLCLEISFGVTGALRRRDYGAARTI